MNRIMALDVGDRRVGIAFSDPTGTLATPFGAVERGESDVDEILRLAEREGAGAIVVGMPYTLAGERGAQAAKTSAFVRALREKARGVSVSTLDERLSTAQAKRLLRESDSGRRKTRRRQQDRGRTDAAAAAVILQGYLDGR